jgi:protein arginine kinase activator
MGLCERCKKGQATFHQLDIQRDGEQVQRHLCEGCAVEGGLLPVHKPVPSNIDTFVKSAKTAAANLVCPQCGISYIEFRNEGPLGCPADYDAFAELLAPLIENAQGGATQHTGKKPGEPAAPRRMPGSEQQALRRELAEAVASEDYKRAAALRDRLRELDA